MANIQPLPEAEAEDRTARTYERIRELLGTDSVPEPFLYYGRVSPFLQDFYMNFKKFVIGDGKLDSRSRLLVALAVSASCGSQIWVEFLAQRLVGGSDESQTVADVIAVASTNYMYNTFFKFRENSGSGVFEGMPVGLRAHTFAGTSLSASEVELINIVISDINGCKPCTSGHVSQASQLGLSNEAILEAIQCASTMLSGIQFLRATGV